MDRPRWVGSGGDSRWLLEPRGANGVDTLFMPRSRDQESGSGIEFA